MHGDCAADVVASAAPPSSSAAVDCLPADNQMKQQAPVASSDYKDSSNTNSRRRLEGKVAIVTGGARGIGEAIARLFVAHGARVVIVDDAAGQVVASSLGPPERCSYERCDVSVEADVERAVRRAVARHGRLDVLCNNAAGVLRGSSSSILALDAAELERAVRVNALGAALGMKHAAGAMLKLKAAGEEGGGGSIVSVASASVAGGMGPYAYAASKHALVGLTKNAAAELGRHGIRVNCISFSSPFDKLEEEEEEDDDDGDGPPAESSEAAAESSEVLKLRVRASDIAEAALFLASDDSRYVSGHNLVVDGQEPHRTVMK